MRGREHHTEQRRGRQKERKIFGTLSLIDHEYPSPLQSSRLCEILLLQDNPLQMVNALRSLSFCYAAECRLTVDGLPITLNFLSQGVGQSDSSLEVCLLVESKVIPLELGTIDVE